MFLICVPVGSASHVCISVGNTSVYVSVYSTFHVCVSVGNISHICVLVGNTSHICVSVSNTSHVCVSISNMSHTCVSVSNTSHICVSVSNMSQDHGGPLAAEDIKEEEVVAQTRKDAKLRYHQFRALSSTSNPGECRNGEPLPVAQEHQWAGCWWLVLQ